MSSYNIRKATKNDCKQIFTLLKELAVHQKMAERVDIDENVLEQDGFGEDKYFHCLVAEPAHSDNQQGMLIGYCLYFFAYSTWKGRAAMMEDLYVTPEWRKNGIATGFIKELIEVALSRGCSRVQFCVLDSNTTAIEFYNRSGAQDLSVKEGWHLFHMPKDAMLNFCPSSAS